MSGRPGNPRTCTLYRSPRACSPPRSINSALESLFLTADIMRDVTAGSRRRSTASMLGGFLADLLAQRPLDPPSDRVHQVDRGGVADLPHHRPPLTRVRPCVWKRL